MNSVRMWLEGLGFGQYADSFEANEIDLDLVRDVDDAALKELGVQVMGHRVRLIRAIGELAKSGEERPPTKQARQVNKRSRSPAPEVEGERRQLTVLFCDMVGFTELASRLDPEVLQTIVRAYEDACAAAITRYEGYVFQRLGDGIVAFFGYPLAHEGEAERAIRAGLDIIEALSTLDVPEVERLSVRIGIATGMVVVASAEKGAVGETMNLAARLQGIAQVNSILVSERVQRLAGGSFEYEDLGAQSLKGIARATHAYRVMGLSKAASRFEAAHLEQLTPLVGRDQEIALLLDRWRKARDGEGQVVLLSGEPGIGKSRILSALQEQLAGKPFNLLSSQCSPFYVNTAFYPVADQMARAAGFERHDSANAKLDKLEALFARLDFNLAEVIPLFASALSIPCGKRYPPLDMSPQKQKDRTMQALAQRVVITSHDQPVLFVVEDLHWSDPTSVDTLGVVIDAVRDARVLVVCTFRPEFDPPWRGHGHAISLNLSKLTRAQSAAIISRVANGKPLPDELVEQILIKTDGVPLYVEELTKSILESGELTDKGDRYEYAGTDRSVTIPATLRDSLMARLDRNMPVKEIAQIGAAIGREFSYELVAAVAPLSTNELDDALGKLTESELTFRRGTPPDATYTFKHALVQDAAYDSLLKSRRQELHDKIARQIEALFPSIRNTEPEVLAQHYTEAGMTEKAIPYWEKAGELAQNRVAYREAIRYFDKALLLTKQLPPSADRDHFELRQRTLLSMTWVALYGYSHPEVAINLESASRLDRQLGGGEYTLQILWGLWVNTLCKGETEVSLERARLLLTTADERDSDDFRLAGHWAACDSFYFLGQFEDSIGHADAILKLYDAERHGHIADLVSHDPRTIALAYKAGAEWILGFPDRALETAMAAVVNADQRKHAFDMCWVRVFTAHEVLNYLAKAQDIEVFLQRCAQMARDQRLLFFSEAYCPLLQALCFLHEGNAIDANVQFTKAIAQWLGAGMQVAAPSFKALHAECKAQCGEFEAAHQLLDESLEQIHRPGWQERYALSNVLRIKAWVLQQTKRPSEAEAFFEQAVRVAREQNAKSWELRAATSLARLWQEQNKRRQAHDLLAPVYNWFTEGFDTKDLKEAKALLEKLAA